MVTRVETQTELLLTARTAHVRQDWHASYEAFVRASEAVPLNTDDLDALAVAAWRLGRGRNPSAPLSGCSPSCPARTRSRRR